VSRKAPHGSRSSAARIGPAAARGRRGGEAAARAAAESRHKRLYQAYQDAYGSIDGLRRALDPAERTLHGTDAWLGPEARQWGGRLNGAQQTLRKAADRILWDIYTTLTATDRIVTTGA
jgi:hypothetical protein